MIHRIHLRWTGHMLRMPDSKLPKAIFYGQLGQSNRSRGRPVKRYKDCLKVALNEWSLGKYQHWIAQVTSTLITPCCLNQWVSNWFCQRNLNEWFLIVPWLNHGEYVNRTIASIICIRSSSSCWLVNGYSERQIVLTTTMATTNMATTDWFLKNVNQTIVLLIVVQLAVQPILHWAYCIIIPS